MTEPMSGPEQYRMGVNQLPQVIDDGGTVVGADHVARGPDCDDRPLSQCEIKGASGYSGVATQVQRLDCSQKHLRRTVAGELLRAIREVTEL